MTIADKLKEQSNRLKNIMNAIETGSLKASDIDVNDIEKLEAIVSDYEQILKEEQK
jgi:saccharopine dehydrogenase-like NADP-dependent oxidoreductase